MVVAQLVERSLPTPEVRSSNPVIGIKLYLMFAANCIEKTKIKKKRPQMAHLKKLWYFPVSGQLVSVLTFYSKSPSSHPAKQTELCLKRGLSGPIIFKNPKVDSSKKEDSQSSLFFIMARNCFELNFETSDDITSGDIWSNGILASATWRYATWRSVIGVSSTFRITLVAKLH